MKRASNVLLLIFSALMLLCVNAFAQDAATDASDPAATEVNEDGHSTDTEGESAAPAEQPAEENSATVTDEDASIDSAAKLYENEQIVALKGTPKAYTDGFNNYVNNKVRFELSTVDNIITGEIFYKVDDQAEQKYSSPFSIKEEGAHVIYYYSVDKMGNREMQKSMNVIVDATSPQVAVTITAPFAKTGEQIYASDKFSYNYSIESKDAMTGVASTVYSLEGQEPREYMKPFVVNSPAPVKVNVASEDKVGNLTQKYTTKIIDENGQLLASSIDDITILIDKTAPEVSIKPDKEFVDKEGIKVASKDYKYTISALDTESGVKAVYYRIDSKSDFILYTGEITFNTNGNHKIEAIAKDGVGNVSKTAELDVFVDTLPAETGLKFITE